MTLTDFIGGTYESKTADCWALCRDVSERLYGRSLPSYGHMYDSSDDRGAAEFTIWAAINSGTWSKQDQPQEGDILIFRVGRWACHAGVYVGGGDFIHRMRGRNTTIERLSASDWGKRLEGIYRWTATAQH